jgi:hypothetical protein
MDHLVLRHPSYMRGFTSPFSLSVKYEEMRKYFVIYEAVSHI